MHPIYDVIYDTVFIVCYEAGAAEVISSLVKNKIFYKNLLVYTEGPACDIFLKKIGFSKNTEFNEITNLTTNDVLLVGRSLIPDLERNAIYIAKLNQIKTISYLDHWVNYDNFFIPIKHRKNITKKIYNEYYPDFILVGDKYAYNLGKKLFGDRLYFIENEYFVDLHKQFKNMELIKVNTNKKLLFICDPISIDNKLIHSNTKKYGFDEFDMIDDILKNIDFFKKFHIEEIIIRPHPNHNIKEFKDIIKNKITQDKIKINIDFNTSLLQQIIESAIVIGMESMALVVALEFNKKVISYIPDNSRKKNLLPHKEIINITKIEQIRNYL